MAAMQQFWAAVQRWLRPQKEEAVSGKPEPAPRAEQEASETSAAPETVRTALPDAGGEEKALPRLAQRWEESEAVDWPQAQPSDWQPPRWEDADPQGQQAGELSRELERLARRYQSLGGEGRR